jgi:MiaB-like tRNA modifying enzyme
VRFDGVVGPAAGNMIVDVVRRVLEGEKIAKLEGAAGNMPSLDLPRLRLNPVVSIIPVNYGCLGSCAYCCVMFARGRLRSYGIDEIVDRVKKDLALGAREFWITSQDTACYGKERGTNLAKLLNTICAIEGDFRIRVGMMTPNATMDILDDLIQAFKDERIFRFLHLPVQSGDDQILKRMRRFYSVADFKAIASAFRASFPELTLSTDLICGFPSESEKAFNRTLELIDEIKPDIVNVSKFFARPRTLAAEMDDSVPLTEIKQRSTMAAKCAKKIALEKNHRWVGWAGEILIDEGGKVPGSWIGRNLAYKPIVVESSDSLLGRTLRVQVKKAFATYLEGKLIQ